MGGNAVIVIEPNNPAPGQRWVWRAEFFDVFPAFNLEMLERGWWIAYMNVGNTFGCPAAMERFDVFYKEMWCLGKKIPNSWPSVRKPWAGKSSFTGSRAAATSRTARKIPWPLRTGCSHTSWNKTL